jgi:hypothetical protein
MKKKANCVSTNHKNKISNNNHRISVMPDFSMLDLVVLPDLLFLLSARFMPHFFLSYLCALAIYSHQQYNACMTLPLSFCSMIENCHLC